jgi:hypothetical protein
MPEGRPQQAQLPEPDSAKTRGILFGDDPDNEDNGILEVTFRLLPVTDSAPDRPVERGDDSAIDETAQTQSEKDAWSPADGRAHGALSRKTAAPKAEPPNVPGLLEFSTGWCPRAFRWYPD